MESLVIAGVVCIVWAVRQWLRRPSYISQSEALVRMRGLGIGK